ncbi:MAG: hypothetical protein K0R62_3091 [Nonomuraea muscovyensis]|nr:hypothetical protein [Nonomuraea muscovyensis]
MPTLPLPVPGQPEQFAPTVADVQRRLTDRIEELIAGRDTCVGSPTATEPCCPTGSPLRCCQVVIRAWDSRGNAPGSCVRPGGRLLIRFRWIVMSVRAHSVAASSHRHPHATLR